MIGLLVYSRVRKLVRAGDRAAGIRLAERWRWVARRSPSACYFEYWARVKDREHPPGEHIDLLRRARRLAPYQMNTGVRVLVAELIRMYAKAGQEEDAAEAERILAETNDVFGDSPWVLSCRSDLAFLRGEFEHARSLQHRALDLDPNQHHPRVLLARAILSVDEGDREGAVSRLNQAASSKDADALVHIYLSVLVEKDDGEKAAAHRAAAKQLWPDSPQGLTRKFDFCRKRVDHGPVADLRSSR